MFVIMIIEAIALLGFGALVVPFIGSYGTSARTVEPPISPSVLYSILLLVACLLALVAELILRKKQKRPSLILGMVSSIIRTALFVAAILAIFFYLMPGYEHLWGNFDFVFKFIAICLGLLLSVISLIFVILSWKKAKKA